jgi:hypothetical protein
MTARCPLCGGNLQRISDGAIGRTIAPAFHVAGRPLPIRMERRPFLACSACEFCEVIETTSNHEEQA